MATKTTCPLTRKEFLANAEPLSVRIGRDGEYTAANPKLFSTQSVGYCLTGKVLVKVADCEVACQVGLNLTAVGSKDMPAEADLSCRFATGQYREDMSMADQLPSKAYFAKHAAAVQITIGTQTVLAQPKKFSSGKLGWYANGKVVRDVNGTMVTFQLGVSIVALGSDMVSDTGIPIASTTDAANVAAITEAVLAPVADEVPVA